MVMAGNDDSDSAVGMASCCVDGCVAEVRMFCLFIVFAATVSIDTCRGL